MMQRYDIDETGSRIPNKDGDYVLADEAEKKIAELEAAVNQTVGTSEWEQLMERAEKAERANKAIYKDWLDIADAVTHESTCNDDIVQAARDTRRQRDELRAATRDLADRLEEARAACERYHNERQELRTILRVPVLADDGTHAAEFGPQLPLVDAARKIVQELDEAINHIEELTMLNLSCDTQLSILKKRTAAAQWLADHYHGNRDDQE